MAENNIPLKFKKVSDMETAKNSSGEFEKGAIYFDDSTKTIKIAKTESEFDTYGKNKIYVGDTEPTDGSLLWLDTNLIEAGSTFVDYIDPTIYQCVLTASNIGEITISNEYIDLFFNDTSNNKRLFMSFSYTDMDDNVYHLENVQLNSHNENDSYLTGICGSDVVVVNYQAYVAHIFVGAASSKKVFTFGNGSTSFGWNRTYVCSSDLTNLQVFLEAPNINTYNNEIVLKFMTGLDPTISWPDYLLWANGSPIEIEGYSVYEFSISYEAYFDVYTIVGVKFA